VPNSPAFTVPAGGSVPEIDGIPCTGHNTGQCIGLSQNAPPVVVPESTISSSP